MTGRAWIFIGVGIFCVQIGLFAQLDPEKRQLIQLGYDQPLEGTAPIGAYGFYYYNKPGFRETNINLRMAVAPVYLDAELGFREVFTPNTDLGIGLAGGGFRDSYSEVRDGDYLRDESFTGHTAELYSSIYHRLNPGWRVPAWLIARGILHRAMYESDSETADDFEVPRDLNYFSVRTGFRMGGREPSLTSPMALEVSLWQESVFRDRSQRYGFNDDRAIESASYLFWGRTFLKYTFENSQQYFDVGLTVGTSIDTDRLSAFRMGGFLPFVAEFPLNIPGYYFQEISAKQFGLLNAEYSFPLTPEKRWRFTIYGAGALVDNLDTHASAGRWHSGVGAGITYVSPRGAWFVSVVYGHGFQAERHNELGANNVGFLFQYDFDAVRKFPYRRFEPGVSPYSSRGGERIFR